MTRNPTCNRVSISAARFDRNEIAEYYNTHQSSYTRFWSRTALHYGLWYDDTKSLAEAITNTNELVVRMLAISSDDVVLDAGCGVGGTSVYIAENTGARVEGVTLSEVQLNIAQGHAAQSTSANRLTFSIQDYTSTNFEAETFSKVFGIESICYAYDKIDFLNEAFRIMHPGGRIVVIDTFLTKDELNPTEQYIYEKFIGGWVVPNLASQTQFHDLLVRAGFTNVKYYDLRQQIEPSVRRVYRFSLVTSPWNYVKSKLGLARENLSATYQKAAFDRQIAMYGVFAAMKPL